MVDLRRSKRHFLHATTRKTGALRDDSHDLPAIERRETIMKMGKPHSKACLSLGCGLGRFLRDYVEHHGDLIVGLDINRNNLKECQSLDVNVVLGDVEHLPFLDSVFDIIDCEATMEHVPSPINAMKEINRVIKPNKGFVFTTWHVYRWITVLTNPTVRRRFLLYVRDLVVKNIPYDIIRNLTEKTFFRILLFDYGTYRNAGFSYPNLQRIYYESKIRIIYLKIYLHVVFIAGKAI